MTTTRMTTTTKMKTTDPAGARATWRSLAVATPIATAVFLMSLAWASAVTPSTGDATVVADAAASATQAPAATTPAAPRTHATSGASK